MNAVIRGNLAATTMKVMMRTEYQQMEMNNAKRTEDVLALNEAIASSRKDIKDAAGV